MWSRGLLPAALLVGALTVIGAALRLAGANRGLFADELSTYWIITAHRAGAGLPPLHGLGGVISLVGHVYPGGDTSEISPPLYFALSWLSIQLGHAPILVRLPSVITGIALVPLIYVLGRRTIGRGAAAVATALAAFSPFLIYYSAEARAYSVMMFLLVVSTLAMLEGARSGRWPWWVLYAVASAGAMLAHYTSAFVLAVQLLWLLWTHPRARVPALVANAGAALLFSWWIPGAINDFRSPTVKILSALSPFDFADARISLEHWLIGYPYANVSLRTLPGVPALACLGAGMLLALGAVGVRAWRERPALVPWLRGGPGLVVLILLSVPVGEALQSAVSTHTFGGRNLAASTPELLLLIGALIVAAGPRLRELAGALVIAAFAIGGLQMVQARYERPNMGAAAHYLRARLRPGDVIIDETIAFSPGPLSSLDTAGPFGVAVFRAGNPVENDHPFGFTDPIVPLRAAITSAVASAHGHTIFLVTSVFTNTNAKLAAIGSSRLATGSATAGAGSGAAPPAFPKPYRLTAVRGWSGFPGVSVEMYTAHR